MPKISLEAVRVNAGYNQKEWAEIFGISNATVVNWEKGKTEPTLSQLRSFLEFLWTLFLCQITSIKLN
jgi:DNA-binding XRE family transcriptional regulator